jgi:DNA-binding MarR family transcriptional regulator
MVLENTIISAIDKLSRVWRFLQQEAGSQSGLTPLQVQILGYLTSSSPKLSGITEISKELELSKPTVSDAVRTLERKKIVKKNQYQKTNERSIYSLLKREKGWSLRCLRGKRL